MQIPNHKTLNNFLELKQNLLFFGKHGVGKTATIKEVFTKKYGVLGKDWLYFSLATVDQYVDFIGIPKVVTDKRGTEVMRLVKPEYFAYDTVKALYLDELNRAPSKIMNSIMELVQFRSINGKKYKNLEVIWASANPYTEDGEYQVNKLDPALQDRFDIQIFLDYALDEKYFIGQFGEENYRILSEWWNNLPPEIKNNISPRRLDNSTKSFFNGIDFKYTLPPKCNYSILTKNLKSLSVETQLEEVFQNKDIQKAILLFENINFVNTAQKIIMGNKSYFEFFVPLLSNETIVQMVDTNNLGSFLNLATKHSKVMDIFLDISKANIMDEEILKKINNFLKKVGNK